MPGFSALLFTKTLLIILQVSDQWEDWARTVTLH